MPAPTNLIINGDFESQFANWTATDGEIGGFQDGSGGPWTEDTYLGNGNTGNTVAEMDGHTGQTTVLEQNFTIGGPLSTDITFDAALRSGADVGDGYTVEILDSTGAVVTTQTILPTVNALTAHSIPVTFSAAGTYTLRFTEVGNDNSLGALLDNVSILACFLHGTHIETKSGPRLIETLQAGDLVRTKDHGLQPIRWVGSTTCAALGDKAPILIRKGTLGNTRDLRVSPNHRMLISGWQAELLFGESELLVPAKDLVNDQMIQRVEGGNIEYFHMMFDQHEIVFSEGTPSESFYPAADTLSAVEQAVKDEILDLFPVLLAQPQSYGPPARASLLPHEAALLQL